MSHIYRTKKAKLVDGSYVYGERDEIDKWCIEHNTSVDVYYNHVPAAIARKNFEFIGEGSDPYVAARNIFEKDEAGRFIGYKVYTEKW